MWYSWDLHFKKVKHWKEIFWDLYHAIGDKEYRLENPIHTKIRIAPCTYVEYRIATIVAKKGIAGEHVKFNLENEQTGESYSVDVYPAFELKSNGEMVNETVIFEMLLKQLKDNGIMEDKTMVVAETVVV